MPRLDKELLQKFFRNQCSPEEIKQVYNWFKTSEGKIYFEESLDRDILRYSDDDNLLLTPDVPSAKIFSKIKQTRSSKFQRKERSSWKTTAAVAAIITISLLSGMLVYLDSDSPEMDLNEISYRIYSTGDEQHRLISLRDGTQIRLNSNSVVEIPEFFGPQERHVKLDGEAWFQIENDPQKPFTVYADAASIHVLGTEFNVKMDSEARNIQIAVSEGTVAFQSENQHNSESIRATLTKNNFALYFPESDEIIIENAPVINYLSWIDGKLLFYNEPLWQVSRTLERLYNHRFVFRDDELRNVTLSADLSRTELPELLNTLSRTLNIEYTIDSSEKKITWTSNINQPLTNHSE